jgi:predicted RNA-binding Zn-ribbon protein involved in translation (DUF1610 family)
MVVKSMAQIISLKCPNCGGLAERNQMKCQYCGAELIILADGSSFAFKNQLSCPQCGARIEASSWFCPCCNKILTQNVEMLRRLQKKIKFSNEENKKELLRKVPSDCMKPLEPDEYFYCSLSKEQGENYFGITNKRLIKFKDGNYLEIPLSEIVSVYPLSAKANTSVVNLFLPIPSKITLQFEVATYQGVQKIDGIQGTPAYCGMFWASVALALTNYEQGKTDIRHVIMNLPLE